MKRIVNFFFGGKKKNNNTSTSSAMDDDWTNHCQANGCTASVRLSKEEPKHVKWRKYANSSDDLGTIRKDVVGAQTLNPSSKYRTQVLIGFNNDDYNTFGSLGSRYVISHFIIDIGSIPLLKEIVFDYTKVVLPIKTVSRLLCAVAGTLESLTFDHCTFIMTAKERDPIFSNPIPTNFWHAMLSLTKLQSLQIKMCRSVDRAGSSRRFVFPCNKLISTRSYSELQQLKQLELSTECAYRYQRSPPWELFPPLSLEELIVTGFDLTQGTFCVLMASLSKNDWCCLRRLVVGTCYIGNLTGEDALEDMLRNNTTLERLDAFVIVYPYQRFYPFLEGPITRGLAQNKHLQKVRIQTWTTKIFIPLEVQCAWLDLVVHRNHVLQDLSIQSSRYFRRAKSAGLIYSDPSLQTKLEHFLNMNRFGRRNVYQQMSQTGLVRRKELVECLIAATNNVSCLFDFLQMDPTVCNTALVY